MDQEINESINATKQYWEDLKKTKDLARKINNFLICEDIPANYFDIVVNGTDILIKIDWEH